MRAQGKALFPFVPSGPSFSTSIEFFNALGFETLWRDGGLAGLRFGGAYFMLQDIDVPEWQKNQMITIEVDDLDLYWSELRCDGSAGPICRRAAAATDRFCLGPRDPHRRSRRRLLARAAGREQAP